MKDFGVTVVLIGAAFWVLTKTEGAPPIRIPVFSLEILAVPLFLYGAWLTFTGKRALVGLAIMFGFCFYFMRGL